MGPLGAALWSYGVTETCLAMAHIKPASSRAMATTTWLACLPRAIRYRKRLHSRTWAFQPMSWIGFGSCSSLSCKWRLTLAGYRLRELFQPELQGATDFSGIPVGPGPLDQGASGMRVTGFGDQTLPASLPTRIF